MSTCLGETPFKTVTDRRWEYIRSLQRIYDGLGYTTKLTGSTLEVYTKGHILKKTDEEIAIQKWSEIQ